MFHQETLVKTIKMITQYLIQMKMEVVIRNRNDKLTLIQFCDDFNTRVGLLLHLKNSRYWIVVSNNWIILFCDINNIWNIKDAIINFVPVPWFYMVQYFYLSSKDHRIMLTTVDICLVELILFLDCILLWFCFLDQYIPNTSGSSTTLVMQVMERTITTYFAHNTYVMWPWSWKTDLLS